MDPGSRETTMNTLDMISGPLLFVEHLRDYSKQVHQVVGRMPLLVAAILAADHEQARRVREQMSELKSEADRTQYTLYGEFKDIRFRAGGEYALGQYVGCLDTTAEASEEFADLLLLHGISIPLELHAKLQAFVAEVVHTSELLSDVADILWPSEETLPAPHGSKEALDTVERIVEGHGQASRLGTEFARHLHGMAGELDPAVLLCLDNCRIALRAAVKGVECAANHLRPVIG
jgi:uncharacterized protein Yka (UPF0111/DUF47 family)